MQFGIINRWKASDDDLSIVLFQSMLDSDTKNKTVIVITGWILFSVSEAETGSIFYSPPHLAPKKNFPASPRPASSFYFSSPALPRLAKSGPRPDSSPRLGLCSVLLCNMDWKRTIDKSSSLPFHLFIISNCMRTHHF
jgi:hypothetical protein